MRAGDVTIVEYNCPMREEWQDVWSTHNYFAFVLTGTRKWKKAGVEYDFEPGDLIFVRKGAHYVGDVSDRALCVMLFLFPDEWIKNLTAELTAFRMARNPVPQNAIIRLTGSRETENVIHSMMQYLSSSSVVPGQLVLLKMKELLYSLFMGARNPDFLETILQICAETKPSIREIMEDNYLFNLKLEDYARLCGRSLTAFKDEFKQLYELPPGRWLASRRLEHARNLLLNTDQPVSAIAFQSGFQNTTHFVKVFKEEFGKPPHSYRQHILA